ncbi:hypothetical protein CXB51_006415 [Gossypium anomalum]|uniref:Transmembrane protein n=1 Tax=Gossypium anomalum TaxID=47600 RepID=A0A8J6D9E4_9ROSI|nr:hypothetical protein CXB51_006415 [Gossypium anomalum]
MRFRELKKMQQSWKLNIQARTQIFNFKLKATKILPTGEFHRFSLLLRLHKFILKLRLKSGSTVSISSQQKRSFKSRFLSFLEKIRFRRERKVLTIQHPDVKSKSNWAASLVIAILSLLQQSISKKDGKGIIIHTCIILLSLYWILYLNRAKNRRFWMVGTAVSCGVFNLGKDYVSEHARNWIPWSHAYGCTVFWFWFAACRLILALLNIFFSYILKLKEK